MANTTTGTPTAAAAAASVFNEHPASPHAFHFPEFVDELRYAHRIIGNALRVMTTEQKAKLAELNHIDGVDGEGATRAHERLALFAQTVEPLPPHVAYVGNWRYVTRERFAKCEKPHEGYLMAIGLGVDATLLVSTADPAWRVMEIERTIATTTRRYADGYVPTDPRSAAVALSMVGCRQFDRIAVSMPVNDAHQLACDLVEDQTGQRQCRLLHEPLEKVVALLSEKIGGAA